MTIFLEKIGAGLQYKVYDLGNGRVLKKTTSREEKIILLSKWHGNDPKYIKTRLPVALKKIEDFSKKSVTQIKKMINNNPATLSPLFGNPEFLDGLDYTQNKVEAIEVFFSKNTLERNKHIIDMFIEKTLLLWGFGISDTVFNFTINAGVSNASDIVFFDFGEFTNSKSIVVKTINNKVHLNSLSCTRIQDENLANYYLSQSKNMLTIRELLNTWGQSNSL